MCHLSKHENPASPDPQGSVLLFSLGGTKKVEQENLQPGTPSHKTLITVSNTEAKRPLQTGHAGGFSLQVGGNRVIKYLTPSSVVLDFMTRSLSLYSPR